MPYATGLTAVIAALGVLGAGPALAATAMEQGRRAACHALGLPLNGKGELKKLKIDKSVLSPDDSEVVEYLILAAFNDARQKVNAHTDAEMQKLTGGLNLPGGMKLPF